MTGGERRPESPRSVGRRDVDHHRRGRHGHACARHIYARGHAGTDRVVPVAAVENSDGAIGAGDLSFDIATQSELDAESARRAAGDAALAMNAAAEGAALRAELAAVRAENALLREDVDALSADVALLRLDVVRLFNIVMGGGGGPPR